MIASKKIKHSLSFITPSLRELKKPAYFSGQT
nr:MAG TPA: hypothetical protein [Bacteriophage sp.]DAW75365.1 MAG TPA: hypothetical protein [Caudoviricetes sp.]